MTPKRKENIRIPYDNDNNIDMHEFDVTPLLIFVSNRRKLFVLFFWGKIIGGS